MMKKLLLVLLCLPIIGFGQLTYVPDDIFEQELINLGYDNVLDDYVTTANINTVDTLIINPPSTGAGWSTSDLTGIEDFTALTYLDCSWNQIANIDVSNNSALTYLDCSENAQLFPFGSLNVNGLTGLTYLDCSENGGLITLDISTNTALTYLDCSGNGYALASLDVSNNSALTYLDCSFNHLTSLDVSNNTSLIQLNCKWNELTNLDVSNNTVLTILDCDINNLTNFDVSGASALTILDCSFNHLTNIDVSNNSDLTYLDCSSNQLTGLDISDNSALTSLDCSSNQLTCLNVQNGNNSNFVLFAAHYGNLNLSCVEVDDVAWSTTNWAAQLQPIYFSVNCNNNCSGNSTFVLDITKNISNLVKITDMLGQETPYRKNQPLFYIYDDGIVEKRIVIE
jgi:Leucine-rich repeat (LRR) protein